MNCLNCGANVDGKAFCPHCGTPTGQQQPAPYNGYDGGYAPVQNAPVPGSNHTQVLIFGIIALALSTSGLVGLIFSIIAMKKAKTYFETFGDVSNQARIGKRLALAGLIVSIIFTVIWTFYLIGMVILIGNNTHTSYHYSYS